MSDTSTGSAPLDGRVRPIAWWVHAEGDIEAGSAWRHKPTAAELAELEAQTRMPVRVIELGDVAAEREACSDYVMRQAMACSPNSATRATLESVSAVLLLYGPDVGVQRGAEGDSA